MVPTIRSAPAANAPSGTGNQRSDSDLDDYELQDNLASFRSPEFHPPVFDLDVALAENMIPGLEDSTQHWHSISLQGQAVAPFHDDSPATISTTETPPSGSASVGAPASCIIVSLADADSLQVLSTLDAVPFHSTLPRTSAFLPSFVHRHRVARRNSLPNFGPIRNQ